jgi:hypothetical protein
VSRLATFALENGASIAVEIDSGVDDQIMRGVSTPAEFVVKANQSFAMALDNVEQAAQSVIDRLRSLSTAPDEIEVEFGVKLNAEAGAVIAKASSEAHFQIGLKWKKVENPKD